VLTNNHVVAGRGAQIKVILADRAQYDAKILYRDPENDLALLKIEPKKKLPFLRLGDSENLQVGQKVLAIGNPFGLEGTLTTGIISSLHRSVPSEDGRGMEDMVQTDAAINPGNSGGPLLNLQGEVIGINTAKISSVEVSGVGFAISANSALPIIDELITKGYVSRPYLGVSLVTVTAAIVNYYDLRVDRGALIYYMSPDTPASYAGLMPGDVIVRFDGIEIATAEAVVTAIRSRSVGDTVQIEYYRGSDLHVTSATLTEKPH
ncbi:MAG: trypsin-like peptidase domain-containing protein, partial [Dehalococcoidia bacterium]|jgi:serine protease Do